MMKDITHETLTSLYGQNYPLLKKSNGSIKKFKFYEIDNLEDITLNYDILSRTS